MHGTIGWSYAKDFSENDGASCRVAGTLSSFYGNTIHTQSTVKKCYGWRSVSFIHRGKQRGNAIRQACDCKPFMKMPAPSIVLKKLGTTGETAIHRFSSVALVVNER